MPSAAVAWFRRDLRLEDNPAWAAATQTCERVTALVVLESELLERAGPFRRAAFLGALVGLDAALTEQGGRLRIEHGDPAIVVPRVAGRIGADVVHCSADVTRWARRRDDDVRRSLPIELHQHWGTVVHAPGTVLTKAGTLSRVFSAFHRRWTALPLPARHEPGSASIAGEVGAGLPEESVLSEDTWPRGELDGQARLAAWLEGVDRYQESRDSPSLAGTSALSTALRFGTISASDVVRTIGSETEGSAAFVRQLAWRDWYAHLTHEQPNIDRVALRPEYDAIRWETGPHADDAFAAWCEGRTGYPIVDAGMRELAATGWMHNRIRMVTASFLVKDLLIDWRRGERHFRHLLRDGDIPQNAGNWQWVAGTGPDAAPYFRVFNPVLQSRRFDPSGAYLRRWLPELGTLDDDSIHAPWEVPPLQLAAAGLTLGEDYPRPIVDHAEAKEETVAAYREALERAKERPTEASDP